MRLTGISLIRSPDGDMLHVTFRSAGVPAEIALRVPGGWDAMTREEKIAHVQGGVTTYLANHVIAPAHEGVFPDTARADQAKDAFDAIPGWATWTPAEAVAWIDANVTDLATAKQVLGKLATAVLHLRDIVIEC